MVHLEQLLLVYVTVDIMAVMEVELAQYALLLVQYAHQRRIVLFARIQQWFSYQICAHVLMEHLIIIKFVQTAHLPVEIAQHLLLIVQVVHHQICQLHLVSAPAIKVMYGVPQVVYLAQPLVNFAQVKIIIYT